MIVALHGAGDTPAQWDPLHALLPDEPLLAWRAPTALDVDYRPSRMAELVADAFTGSAAVVGFSWGASVAARFAAAHPVRIEALVLVEGAHVDFRHLDGYEPPASRDTAVSEHGLDGALHWELAGEPNEDIWPALQAGSYPLVLIASAVTEGFAAAVPRARVVRGAGHEIDHATVAAALSRIRGHTRGASAGSRSCASYAETSSRAESRRRPVDGSK